MTLPVVGVFRDYNAGLYTVVMGLDAYRKHWKDRALTGLGIRLGDGADVADVQRALSQVLGGRVVRMRSSEAIEGLSLGVFDRTFKITEVLRVLAAVVAFLGVLSALLSIELERGHELAVLRALGFEPRQLAITLLTQTGLLGVAAGLAAVPIGVGLAALLVYVINQRSFGWSMDLVLAPGPVDGGRRTGRRGRFTGRDLPGGACGADGARGSVARGMRMGWNRRRFAFALGAVVAACTTDRAEQPGAPRTKRSLTGVGLLGDSSASGFEQAVSPRRFVFPADHGSHPRFRTEWWYFTGNVGTARRERFGFELTFFRIGLSPQQPQQGSAWRTNQLWMAHLAVTEAAQGRFVAYQRLARGALGLAGAAAEPFRVWVDDWSVSGDATDRSASLALLAKNGDVGLDLRLEAEKPAVLQGSEGFDRKGPEAGNASYYYSMPRLRTSGQLTVGGVARAVDGLAWMDREWSTSVLSAGVAGWEWFALQLDDGRDLMFYRLRRADGGVSEFSSGTIVDRSGSRRALSREDVQLRAQRWWRSPASGVNYPVEWLLEVPTQGLRVQVGALIPNQEVDLAVRYWEGAVVVKDDLGRGPRVGRGYLELAGYE